MPNIVTVDTTRLPVHSVSVFQSDRAEVRRLIPVELKNGQNEVCIERLPRCLDKDSIRVEGLGNAVIFDVIYTPPPKAGLVLSHNNNYRVVNPDSDEVKALNETKKRLEALRAERGVVKDQISMLATYAATLTAGQVDHSKLASFLELYEQRKRKLDADLLSVDENIASAQRLVNEQKGALMLDDASSKRNIKVTVVVLAEDDGPAELSLSYGVSGASWSPLYDLRAQIGATSTEGSKDKPHSTDNALSVHYRASIAQSTGEDWTDVALDLSTASPHLGTKIPILAPYHISIPPPAPPPPQLRKRALKSRGAPVETYLWERESRSRSPSYEREANERLDVFADEGMPRFAPAPRMAMAASRTVEGAISTNFVIRGLSTVPSDSDHSQGTHHKVTVAEFDLDPKLEWIAVPKRQPSVFLRCRLKNTSPHVLLPGPASVFMDGNFVCKSSIPLVSSGEAFSTSLGTDPALRVTYHPLVKKSKNATGSKFLSLQTKTDVTSHVQRVSIENTRLADIHLSLKDHIPTSDHADYKVMLVEPTLQEGRKEWTTSRNGVKSRWAPANDSEDEDDANANATGTSVAAGADPQPTNFSPGENGMIEWGWDIGAGRTVDLTLAWDIAVPRGQTWVSY